MKTFFEPVQGMAGIEEIKKSFSRLGHAVMVSGCIDTQKAHLLEALGEQYPIRVVITSDEVKARQLREDCLFFDKSSIYYPAKDFIFYNADIHGNLIVKERINAIKHIAEHKKAQREVKGDEPKKEKQEETLTVITTIDGCIDKLLPLEYIENNVVHLEVGEEVNLTE